MIDRSALADQHGPGSVRMKALVEHTDIDRQNVTGQQGSNVRYAVNGHIVYGESDALGEFVVVKRRWITFKGQALLVDVLIDLFSGHASLRKKGLESARNFLKRLVGVNSDYNKLPG